MRYGSTGRNALALAACAAAISVLTWGFAPASLANADPAFSYYGYMEIQANPNPAVSGENTHITVTVSNLGTDPATNVEVKLSFNDWGVTFQGWQEIGTETVALIAPGGSAAVEFDYVFQTRAHTCIEALVVSADANDNLANDRGQINMEVINAGEVFEYYVPIVNNGEGDLMLQVRGECAGIGPDGGAHARCRLPQEDVFVPAGEAVFVPVQVEFMPGVPRGEGVDVIVNAVDLQNPGDARTMNHVVLRVVANNANGLIQDAAAMLAVLPPLPPPAGNRIAAIAGHLQRALAPELWQDDFRLKPTAAARVIAQVNAAITQAMQVVDQDRVPFDWKQQLEAAVRALTDASRILAQTRLSDLGGNARGEALFQEADGQRLAGAYQQAARNYGHVTVLK